MSHKPGTRLGPYEILSPIGAGGMGEVYRARDHRLDRDVAVKCLSERVMQDPATVERFLREARAASALNHPNIVTIYEIGEATSGRFIAMELVQGQSLRALAAQPLSLDVIVRVATQVARALAVAHASGIVHRDIKPENIMVRDDGYVKLVDFGLARPVTRDSEQSATAETVFSTSVGLIVGTFRYLSPEQARGEPLTTQSDIFSLGLVLYELASGLHPFKSDSDIGVLYGIVSQPAISPSRLNPQVPAALDALIMQMLHKEPHQRPTADDVATMLAGLNETRSALAVTPRVVPTARRTVGREREHAALNAGLAKASAGHGLLMCIGGEPGIGKTTLVEEFLADLAASDQAWNIGQGRCSERLAGTEAYLPLLEVLDSLVRGKNGDMVARIMKVLAPSWYAQIAPAAGSVAAQPATGVRAASQERLKRELSGFLQELSRLRPTVLFLDDVHWADISSVDVLAYLANRFEQTSLLILASYRPTELRLGKHPFQSVMLDLEARGVCQNIALPFLTRADVDRYMSMTFPKHDFPKQFPDVVYTKTEGSPLFMVDLLRYLRDRHIIDEQDGRWTLAATLPEIERLLPESIRSMIQRKIDLLSDSDRRLLSAASVQGLEFDAAVIAAALDLDASEVEEQLETLARTHGLLSLMKEHELPDRTLTLRYRFVHALYQNALYASLTPARKGSLSGAVARALLTAHGDQSAAIANELARLLEVARDFPRACQFFLKAAAHANRVFAFQECVLLSGRGLDLVRRLPTSPDRDRLELALLVNQAIALTATASYASPAVGQAYERARELCQQIGAVAETFPVLHGLYRFYGVRAQLDTAVALGEELLALAAQTNNEDFLIEAHRAAGTSLTYRGDLVRGRQHLEEALRSYDHRRHAAHVFTYGTDPGASARTVLGMNLWTLGYPEQAVRTMREALVLARELAHPFNLVWAVAYASLAYYACGDLQTTTKLAQEAKLLATEHGFPFFLGSSTIIHGAALADMGEFDAGIESIQTGMKMWEATGAVLFGPYYLLQMATALGRVGKTAEALARAREAQELIERNHEDWWAPEAYRVYGELLLTSGADNAEEWFTRALEVARTQQAKSMELRAAMSLMQLSQQRGDVGQAHARLADVYGWFTEGFETADLKRARALLQQV